MLFQCSIKAVNKFVQATFYAPQKYVLECGTQPNPTHQARNWSHVLTVVKAKQQNLTVLKHYLGIAFERQLVGNPFELLVLDLEVLLKNGNFESKVCQLALLLAAVRAQRRVVGPDGLQVGAHAFVFTLERRYLRRRVADQRLVLVLSVRQLLPMQIRSYP